MQTVLSDDIPKIPIMKVTEYLGAARAKHQLRQRIISQEIEQIKQIFERVWAL